MNTSIGWFFPADQADQWDGFNNSGIATFASRPMKGLAREAIQNSLDAGGDGTVKVDIKLHSVDVSTIPDIDNFRSILDSCKSASATEEHKAKVFFENAVKLMSARQIQVLEISDFNTSGMIGPSTNGTPYFAYMKATGQSKKPNSTSTGSWGIGKLAPYAVSNLRTIFVSTIFQDEEGDASQYTQGKSILMSHDEDGRRHRGTGFWGETSGCQPVESCNDVIPSWISRTNDKESIPTLLGTKLSILGFIESENWRELLVATIVENFFGAIFRGRISINIDDRYQIERDSIVNVFENEQILGAIEKQKDKEAEATFNDAKNYLRVLENDHAIVEQRSQQKELGQCRVRILVDENLPRKVCILRNGMLITDSLPRLKLFSNFKEFIAVVECLNEDGNELLREMEPPKHNTFEPNLLPTPKEKRAGQRALKDLAKWVREMLKRYAKDPVSDRTELDELRDFFGDEDTADSGSGEEEINPFGQIQIRARPVKRKRVVASSREQGGNRGSESQNSDGRSHSNTQSSGGDGPSKGTEEGGDGGGHQGTVNVAVDIRSITRSSDIRTIYFTPTVSGKTRVRLKAVGADSDYDLSIIETSEGLIDQGGVLCEVNSGDRFALDLKLKNGFTGAIKVVANEV